MTLPSLRQVERAVEDSLDEEALFKEARRRRRRATALLAVLVLSGAVIASIEASGGARPGPAHTLTSAPGSAVSVNAAAMAGHGDLAFVSLGALYVVADGHLRLVVAQDAGAGSPVYSPNGRFLAYDFGGNEVGVALADGRDGHTIGTNGGQDNAIAPQWLPGGDLLIGTRRYEITSSGLPIRVADSPAGLEAFSPSGDRYVFVTSSMKTAPGTSPAGTANWTGTERIEVSSSLFGPRSLWHSTPIRLDRYGVHGEFTSGVVVLPNRAGILIWTDPDHNDDADGDQLYELRARGGPLTPLAITVGHSVTIGGNGAFSVSAGGPRVAWIDKTVERCDSFTARCVPVGTSKSTVTITPAWSPDGSTLAYVQAAAMSNWNFPQSVLDEWYSTHELVLKSANKAPVVVKGSQGATDPVWSANGKSLLFVDNDGLYLLARSGGTPQPVAKPLFPPDAWTSYYGQVNWAANFSWSQAAS